MPLAENSIELRPNGGVVWRVVALDPCGDLGRVGMRIAGDERAVRDPHDEGRVVGAAVRVDQEAREARQDRRSSEAGGEVARDRRGADVPGDVARQLAGRQAERAVHARQRVRGVVAQEEQAGCGIARDDLDGIVGRACFDALGTRHGSAVGD